MLHYRIHNDALSFDGHDPAIESEDEDNTEPDSSDYVDGNFEDSESEDDEDEPILNLHLPIISLKIRLKNHCYIKVHG